MSLKTDFPDGLARCGWLDGSADYTAYHDLEWGRPVADDRALFEQLSLEGFQSGLSWRTILNKREAFRRGFSGFDPARVARYGEKEIQVLLADAGIVRHRGKIEAVINNAGRALEMIERVGSWRHSCGATKRRARRRQSRRVGVRSSRRPFPRRSRSWAGSSWGRPRSMPSCSLWAWSTTMTPAAIAMPPRNARGGSSRVRGRPADQTGFAGPAWPGRA